MEITRIITVAEYIKQHFKNLHATGTYISGETVTHLEYVCKTPLEVVKEKFVKLCDVLIIEDTNQFLKLKVYYNEEYTFEVCVWRSRAPSEHFLMCYLKGLDRAQRTYINTFVADGGYRMTDKELTKNGETIEVLNKTKLKNILKIKNL